MAGRGPSVSLSGILLAESGGGENNSNNNNTSVLRTTDREELVHHVLQVLTHAIHVVVSKWCYPHSTEWEKASAKLNKPKIISGKWGTSQTLHVLKH